MAKKQVQYESILEQLHKEYGESYKAVFSKDRAQFNLPSSSFIPKMNKGQQNLFTAPVGGRERPKGQAGDAEEFSDENAQLKTKPSSTIQSAAYWPAKEYLLVSFKSGATYSYNGVGVDIVQEWQEASSAGSFFYYNIRMNYSYTKMG